MKDSVFIILILILVSALGYLVFLHLEFGTTISIGIEVLGAYYLLLDEIVLTKKAQIGNKIDLTGATEIKSSPAIGKLEFIKEGKSHVIYHYGKFISSQFKDALNLISLPSRIKYNYIKYFRSKEELNQFCKITLDVKAFEPESIKALEHRLAHILDFSPIRKLGYIYLFTGLLLHFFFSLFH